MTIGLGKHAHSCLIVFRITREIKVREKASKE